MDIDLLTTFLEVARTRHFGKAAQGLFITQSAVSARVRQLEATLGQPLFTRHRNNIQLTPEGLRLKKHAEAITQTWARARQEAGLPQACSGALAIGAMWDLWEIMLNDWVSSLRAAMPDTGLSLESATAESLIRKLGDGVLDLAFLFEPPQQPGLEIRPLAAVRLRLVATRDGLNVEEALGSGYVMVDWGTAFSLSHARLLPMAPPPVLRVNLGSMALRYLADNGGAAWLPEQMLHNNRSGTVLYLVDGLQAIERPAYAVYRSASDRDSAIRDALVLL